MGALLFLTVWKLSLDSVNANLLLILGLLLELNLACDQSKQGVVLADANIVAGMDGSTSLANNDATCRNGLTVSGLYTKTLRLAIAAVFSITYAQFMREQLQTDS